MTRLLLTTAVVTLLAGPAFATGSTTATTTIGDQKVVGANQNNAVTLQGVGGSKVTVGSNNRTTVNNTRTTVTNNNHQKTINNQKSYTDNRRTVQGGRASAVATGGTAAGGTVTDNSQIAVQGGATTVGGSAVTVEAARRSAIAPAMGSLPSGPCTGQAAGLTIGLPGMSGGLQGSAEDTECTLRENIRVVSQFDPSLAREMLNDLSGVRAARRRLHEEAVAPTIARTGSTPVAVESVASLPTDWTASHTR